MPAADPIKFTVDKTKLKAKNSNINETPGAAIKSVPLNKDIKAVKMLNGALAGSTSSINSESSSSTNDVDGADDLLEQLKLQCSRENKEACMMCSS
jgi:hypothetical protein